MVTTIESAPTAGAAGRLTASMHRLATPRALVVAFVTLHLAFFAWLLPIMLAGDVEGDLPLYRHWAMGALERGVRPGIDTDWVYPIGALVPVILPAVFGAAAYQFVWFLLFTSANGISLWVLTDGGRRRTAFAGAWWWLGMLLVLSPVALLRLESFTSPLVIVALVLLVARPRLASILLTLATWIKVWPAAVVVATLIASSRRRLVAAAAGVTSLTIVALALAAGGASHLTSFLTTQGDRGLQLEGPLSTPWLWMAVLRVPGASVYQDWRLETREVGGAGDAWMIEHSSALMFVAIAAVAGLIAWARWRQRAAGTLDDDQHLLLMGSLALATAFIVFNKVGSPQYMLWLAPIVAVGLATSWRTWRVPGALLGAIGVTTTLVFPIFYLALIDLDPAVAAVLGLRNLLLVVLFAWTIHELWRIGRTPAATRPVTVPDARVLSDHGPADTRSA